MSLITGEEDRIILYLQFTVRVTEAVALLTLFPAVHQYTPSWFLFMFFSLRIDPTRFHSFPPSLVHVMLGVGLPVALHDRVTSSVSLDVWFVEIAVMFGRTARFEWTWF